MAFTVMAALGQMKYEIKTERVVDSTAQRRNVGNDLDGRPEPLPAARFAVPGNLLTAANLWRRLPATSGCREQRSTVDRAPSSRLLN